jgi:hypothetical protein
MKQLPRELVDGILAGIRAGKTVQIIHAETGVPESTIRYQAARRGLVINSRYFRVRPGNYWNRLLGEFWREQRAGERPRLNTQMGVSLIAQHGPATPCSAQDIPQAARAV